jgi:GTP-binding protein
VTEAGGSGKDPLVIRSVEFLGGLATEGGWRPETTLPEIAFAGRSNVGKSSLINKLLRRKKVARVSNTPGRTREINFFEVNGEFVLVDLPGYGYAKVSKERKATWRPLIEGYLRRSPTVKGVVQLLDARRTPSSDDIQMLEFLSQVGTPTIVIATKIDKLPRAERSSRVEALALEAGVELEQVIPFSSVTGEGRDELAEALVRLLDGG